MTNQHVGVDDSSEAARTLAVADLTHRHLQRLVRIASANGQYAVAGILHSVAHRIDEPSVLGIQVSADNVVAVAYEVAVPVELPLSGHFR